MNKEKTIREYDKDCKKAIKKGRLDPKKDLCICAKYKQYPVPINKTLDNIGACFRCKAKIVYRKYNKAFKKKICMDCVLESAKASEQKDISYIG